LAALRGHGLACYPRGLADKKAQEAHAKEEAQEDAQSHPLAEAGGPVAGSAVGVNRRAEIKMSPEEVDRFLHEERTAAMCSMHPDGSIHAVAMWYGFLDGVICVETKRKSQKVQNLRRDPRVTFLVEAGESYDQLRGVEIVGKARIIEDPDSVWSFGVSMWERYVGPYDESQRGGVEAMMRNRLLVTVDVEKIVSWDHRKLAGPDAGLGAQAAG
jgi:PPOX class probable F420-dependent enzyme